MYRVKVYLETRIMYNEANSKGEAIEMAFEIMRSRVYWWVDPQGTYHFHPVRKVKVEVILK